MRAVPASHGLPMTNGSAPSWSALNWRAFSAWVGKGSSIRLTWDSSFLRFVVRWRVFPPIRSRQIPLKIRLHFTPSTHPTWPTGLRFTGSAAIRGLSRAGATRLATRFKSSSSLLETRPPLPWAVRPRRTRRTQHSVVSQKFVLEMSCHPERVRRITHQTLSKADNRPFLSCAGTVWNNL